MNKNMARKKTDYSKPEVIRRFREIANRNQDWHAQQDTVLAGMSCKGDIPPPHPEMPDVERRPRDGTAMSRSELRHCFRDVCKSVGWLKQCSAKQMDAAWLDRRDSQEALAEFFPANGGWGKYHDLRSNIDGLKKASERVAKLSALDDEKRRLALVAAEATHRFSIIEDTRFKFDEVRTKYPGSFPEISGWSPPIPRDAEDTRRRVEIEISEIDFSDVGLDGKKVFYIEAFGGRIFGDRQLGPLYFTSADLAGRYVDEKKKCCISEGHLTPDAMPNLLLWFHDHHKFVSELPGGGSWLFQEYPELVTARARDDSELDESLAMSTGANETW